MRKAFLLLLLLVPVAPARAAAPPVGRNRAVAKGLVYLRAAQKADGTWALSRAGNNTAATSFAVLALLSAGHSPGKGPSGQAIEKGARALLKAQQASGLIASSPSYEMYEHGIATLALAQVHADARKELRADVRKGLDKASALVLKGQRTARGTWQGGWRYRVAGTDADLSVSGWQLLALRGARDAGCDVPAAKLDRALEFVRRCADRPSGGLRYVPTWGPLTPTCTANGILALAPIAKSGSPDDDTVRRATVFLLKSPPRLTDAGTPFGALSQSAQALALVGGPAQVKYGEQVQAQLLPRQGANGSWLAGGSESYFGPNYCTALAVLALTAEDRRLPLFRAQPRPAK